MTEVLSIPRQPDGTAHFTSSPLRRSPPSQTSFLLGNPTSYARSSPDPKVSYVHPELDHQLSSSCHSSPPLSPHLAQDEFSDHPSYTATPASSLSLNTKFETDEDDIVFPSYDDGSYFAQHEDLDPGVSPPMGNSYTVSPSTTTLTTTNASRPNSPEPTMTAGDDTQIRNEPSRHVDYLSHEWKEEDIWSSWRHVVSKRAVYSNSSRLENAAWRTWTKSKYTLKTVSPETLNWLKDCDVTWLYGPLQTGNNRFLITDSSMATSDLSRSNSFVNKKPILKKRSLSEVMLQRSISSSSLMKQATDALRAQQYGNAKSVHDRPLLDLEVSDLSASSNPETPGSGAAPPSTSSSGLQSPSERRHIHFNDKVEQCIAIDSKDGDDEYCHAIHNDDDYSDEDVIMMKSVPTKAKLSNRSTPRNSFSNESKTIAMLPSTTLNYRGDTPEPAKQESKQAGGFWRAGAILSPSPSQETLRPSKPSTNFLLDDDDDEDADLNWSPAGTPSDRRSGTLATPNRSMDLPRDAGNDEARTGLRRTPSGMFMPYEEDEDDAAAAGLFGRVVDTVNTAKDIAHVIWNVGWRR